MRIELKFLREVMHGEPDSICFYNVQFNKLMRVLKFSQIKRDFYDPQGAIAIQKHKYVLQTLVNGLEITLLSTIIVCERSRNLKS